MSIAQSIAAEFQHEAGVTRTLLEKLPEDRFDWQPHEKSMSLGRLAGHIAEGSAWLGGIMDQEELDFAADNGFEPFTPRSSAELLQFYDSEIASFAEKIAGYSDEDFLVTWSMRKGDQVMAQMPRVAVVRSFVLNHHYHHRGQLSVYMRLLGVPVPMIYGPTADEQGDFGP